MQIKFYSVMTIILCLSCTSSLKSTDFIKIVGDPEAFKPDLVVQSKPEEYRHRFTQWYWYDKKKETISFVITKSDSVKNAWAASFTQGIHNLDDLAPKRKVLFRDTDLPDGFERVGGLVLEGKYKNLYFYSERDNTGRGSFEISTKELSALVGKSSIAQYPQFIFTRHPIYGYIAKKKAFCNFRGIKCF